MYVHTQFKIACPLGFKARIGFNIKQGIEYIETRYDPAYVIDSVYKVYVKNTGTAVWSKTDVDLVFVSADGPDADYFYGNIGEIKDLPRSVAPGEIVEIRKKK